MRVKDRTGEQVNLLSVLHFDRVENNRAYYWCLCFCGNIKSIRTCDLFKKDRNLQSCGCAGIENRFNDNPWPSEFRAFLRSLKTRDIPNELTLDEWTKLILDNCYYCGGEPNTIPKNGKRFKKNGIDRLFSDGGLLWQIASRHAHNVTTPSQTPQLINS
jgi:hypothetical protein